MKPAPTAEEFFELTYAALRQQKAMRWMRRMFGRLIEGHAPQLVDLPTGAGKTDLIVVWLLALAWYAQDREHRSPVPRRMVWVVNRRVLVQQVFELADVLQAKLSPVSEELSELRRALRSLCRDFTGDCLRIVQLRGQLVDDREWSFDPSVPQLIIGTVDQIGSRLLFQGYGLGKWARPLHAALLGVDAWVCVDEAHLVPAFALTLRQMREHASKPIRTIAGTALGGIFNKLPFWSTELSATPALPRPDADAVFQIAHEDRNDVAIADRLLAAESRVVSFHWISDGKKIAEELAKQAAGMATNGAAVAVFCRTVATAEKVSDILGKKTEFKDRVLTITGRLRGYERDRLKEHPLFSRFQGDRPRQDTSQLVAFLVGTAAAEVGLDADADAIVCDLASMPTLLQRLGRLDRRGILSKRAKDKGSPLPTMTVVDVKPDGLVSTSALDGIRKQLQDAGRSAEFLTGSPWRDATTGDGIEGAIKSATWEIIRGEIDSPSATPPNSWLAHNLAAIPFGPVVVPPLTSAVLAQWAATTPHPSRFLPVHPWLYGLLPDSEGTPLVGVAFRVELDLLQHEELSDDTDSTGLSSQVLDALHRFPPLRAELHFVPLSKVRDWLDLPASQNVRAAFYDGDEWFRERSAASIRPDTIMVLPTSVAARLLDDLLAESNSSGTAQFDVFEPVSSGAARYRRAIKVTGNSETASCFRLDDGAVRFTVMEDGWQALPPGTHEPDAQWKFALSLSGKLHGLDLTISYFRKAREKNQGQLLIEHHTAAAKSASALSAAIAPGDGFLKQLLEQTARIHDSGKEYPKWQRAMGNDDLALPVAKPKVEQPASVGGFRHEWESHRRMTKQSPDIPAEWNETQRTLWLDLWHHLVVAHHGHFRPSMPDRGFTIPPTPSKQNAMRLEAVERYARLQGALGPWRLAYLEGLLKAIDVEASRETPEDNSDES